MHKVRGSFFIKRLTTRKMIILLVVNTYGVVPMQKPIMVL